MSDTENDIGHDQKRRRLEDSTGIQSRRYEPGVAGSSSAMSLARILSPPPQAAPFPRESLTQSPQRNEASYVPESMDVWLKREEETPVESGLSRAGPSGSPLRADVGSSPVLVREQTPDHGDQSGPLPQPISLESWLADEEAGGKGKGKARAIPDDEVFGIERIAPSDSLPHLSQLDMDSQPIGPAPAPAEPPQPPRPRSPTPPPATEYNCPICFCPPTAAVLTPCGHIMCGSCLFSAIDTANQRARMNGYGGEALEARCPVCRAKLEHWDGKGGGVIGMELKVALNVP